MPAGASSSHGSASACSSTRGPSSRTASSRTWSPVTFPPTASSPAPPPSTAGRCCVMANDSTVKAGSWGCAPSRRSSASSRPPTAPACRWSTSSTPRGAHHRPDRPLPRTAGRRPDLLEPGPRQRVHPAGVRPVRSVPPAVPTSPPSVTSSSWSRATPRCTSAPDRMVEMVTGEKTTLEAMGGARMHCTESGVGSFLVTTEQEALDTVRTFLSYLPSKAADARRGGEPRPAPARIDLATLVPHRAAGLRHAALRARDPRRGLVLRDPGAVGT